VAIDLNADLGEGFGIWRLGDDDALMSVVTSANVACGFHAGDPITMQRVCEQAAARGVAIGAQVGYRDLAGFGRRRIDIPADELTADLLYQVGALQACARAAGAAVAYLKPHGALYNTAADDQDQARAIVRAASLAGDLPVLGLPGSALAVAVEAAGLRFVAEGFIDRAYTPNGRLVPRTEPGAVHHDAALALEQARELANGRVTATDGALLAMPVHSLCLHGDTAGAVELASAVRAALEGDGIELGPFATP
jgi:UPF0271 protein